MFKLSEIAQMVKQGLVKFCSIGPVLKSRLGRVFFNREKQLFAMNSVQDLNSHAETHLSDTLYLYGKIKVPTEKDMVYLIHTL